MKRIYIAGPMTGLPDLNRREFFKAERHLCSIFEDCEIQNPAQTSKTWGWTEETPLRAIAELLLAFLTDCDAIYMLRGWEQSNGATAEHAVAKWIGLEVIYQGEAE